MASYFCKASSTLLCLFALLPAPPARAQTVSGYNVEVYATGGRFSKLSFDTTGALYAGRDDLGGQGDPLHIFRIPAGGGAAAEFGAAINDPDAVLVDTTGAWTGTPNAVLVGHSNADVSQGIIDAILPDGTLTNVVSPTATFRNPHDLQFDPSRSRIVLIDYDGRMVGAVVGGSATKLFDLPAEGVSLAVDGSGNLYASALDGVIRLYDADGNVLNANFAANAFVSHLEFGQGGAFGTDLYGLGGGNLLRYDALGNATVIGSGFGVSDFNGVFDDLLFGPDGALYVSDHRNERILRISPSAVPEPTSAMLFASVLGSALLLRRKRLS